MTFDAVRKQFASCLISDDENQIKIQNANVSEFYNDHNSRSVFWSKLSIFIRYGLPLSGMTRYRKHRSGLKVPIDVVYTPNRGDRLIGYSYKQMQQMEHACFEAGFNGGQMSTIHTLWKLYDRGQIVDKLNVVCPGHGYKKTSLKTPMLVLWIQNEDINQNQEIIGRIRSYSYARMTKAPTRKEEPPKKQKSK